MGQQLASLKRQCQSRGPSCGFALLRIAAQDVWVLVLGWSRTMATASCWVSLEAGGEGLIESLRTQRLENLGHQVGLALTQRRPDPHAGPPPQALSGPCQQRRPLAVALRERQLRVRGQAQGHAFSAAGRHAQLQCLVQDRPGRSKVALQDGHRAELYP